MTGTLFVQFNPALASFGLDALATVGSGQHEITDNAMLPTCKAEQLRDRLMMGTWRIVNNSAAACP